MATLGIIGAGKLGTTIGQLALRAGWNVLVHDSSPDPMLPLIVSTVLPGAELVPLDRMDEADVVVLAVPHSLVDTIGLDRFSDRVVVDATNPWAAVDNDLAGAGSSARVLSLNPAMRLVKTLNHFAYSDLGAESRPAGAPLRRALAVASDDEGARRQVAQLVDDLGFDPLEIPFEHAGLLEPDGPVFGRGLTRDELARILADAGGPDEAG